MTSELQAVPTGVASSESASSESAPAVVAAAVAAAQAVHTMHVEVPLIGEVTLPSADELAFVGGLVALGVVGALEWPLVAVLGVGRVLSHAHRWRSLAAFGDALGHA